MKPFDVFIAFVGWGSGGKRRPVLMLSQENGRVHAFQITTKYETKSEAIRNKYFKINDLRVAGLNRQSYVDTNNAIKLLPDVVAEAQQIGKLSDNDIDRLTEFLVK